MTHIAMLLSNPFRPDPRVLKEAESLQSAGYNVTILCWDREASYTSEEMLPSGVRVIRVQSIPSTYGLGSRQFIRLVRFWVVAFPILNRLQPDLVHCHDFDTLPAGLIWGKLHRRPIVYDAHEYYADLVKPRLHGVFGTMIYITIRAAEHACARLASAVVTVDENLGETYRNLNHKVVIIGHYPNLQNFEGAAPVFSRGQLTLMYMGRVSEDRGMLIYANILRHLQRLGVPTRLLLAGAFTPTSEEEVFQHATQDLETLVEWLGWIDYDQVPRILQAADVGLVILKPEPRYVASLPVKLFEYMAAGLPVVASDFPSIARVVQGANCGILVNPEADPALVAQKIHEWWSNPEIPQALGSHGYQAARQKYAWEKIAGNLGELYRSLLT